MNKQNLKPEEVIPDGEVNLKHFKSWWDTLKPQYKTPEIIFEHFKRYFPKLQSIPVDDKEEGEVQVLAEIYANNEGYPQSDKVHFETTYWTQHNIAANGFKVGYKAAIKGKRR